MGAKGRSGRTITALLDAIYENPDDRDLISVWADRLAERDDPRAELIALQLAREVGAVGAAAEARERGLILRRGEEWAGALARAFPSATFRRFERGLFTGGRIAADFGGVSLARREWQLIRELDLSRADEGTLRVLAHVPRLRRLLVDDNALAATLSARTEALPSVTELGFGAFEPASELGAFPSLNAIEWTSPRNTFDSYLRTAPVIERVGRVAVSGQGYFDLSILPILAERGGALREVTLRAHYGRRWTLSFRREVGPGPFTRMIAWHRGGAELDDDLDGLASALGNLTTAVCELVVEIAYPRPVRGKERLALRDAIARVSTLEHVTLPAEVTVETVPGSRPADLIFDLQGASLWDRDGALALYDFACNELGLTFDQFQLGWRNKLRPLGAKPRERIASCIERHDFVELLSSTSTSSIILGKVHPTVRLRLPFADRDVQTIVDTFAALLTLRPFTHGACIAPYGDATDHPYDRKVGEQPVMSSSGWLLALTPWARERAPNGMLAPLVVAIHERPHHLILQVSAAPIPDPDASWRIGRRIVEAIEMVIASGDW